MSSKLKTALSHGTMAYLFSLGLALTLLGVTGLLRHGWLAVWVLLALSSLTAAASLNRRMSIGAACLGGFAGGLWLLVGGVGIIGEVSRALIWHMSGLTTALPMVGEAFTVLICVLSLVVSWFVTQRSAGAFPALILLVLAAVLLWLGDWPDVLVCLLPSVLACVTLLLRAGDEQTSTLRVLPLAAVVTAIAFSAVWMGGVTATPLKKLADDIRQRIYDTFFYTQPRDVFTLASEGYYPQGQGQLGGPATPLEEPVMAVITPRKAYLRGVVKNIYTGRTWLDDIGGRRYLMSASRFDDLRTTTFDQHLPMLSGTADASLLAVRTLQVRMLRDSASTLFVPQRLRSIAAEGALVPYFNASSEVFATSNLTLGDVWTVEAPLFTSADAGLSALVKSADSTAGAHWEDVCGQYLQLHANIDQRVYEVAAQVTGGIVHPYDQAMALQQYLQANFAYSLDVPEQSPNHDFVSTFLVETQEGYCTYFASAMTVLCRMAGLPARYVEGYVAYPDETGLAVVTGKEGHAWTEVYFRGFGWVTFDATPVSADMTQLPPDASTGDEPPEQDEQPPEEPTPSPTPESTPDPQTPPEPTPSPSPETDPQAQPSPEAAPIPEDTAATDSPDAPWRTMLLWLLLALAALRVLLVQPGIQARMAQTPFRRWMVWTQATHDALRRYGLRRDIAETPSAFLLRADQARVVQVTLAPLAQAENLMFYGHAEPYQEEIDQAKAMFSAVWKGMTPWQKLLFQGKRILLSKKFGAQQHILS